MLSKHETIEYANDMPVKICIQSMKDTSRHWHSSLEIYLVLSGELTLIVDSKSYQLLEDDIILVNSNQFHEIHSKDNVTALLQIKNDFIQPWMAESAFFECNSTKHHNTSKYFALKKSIAKLIHLNYNAKDYKDILLISQSYQLIHELIMHFRSSDQQLQGINCKNLKRLKGILTFLNDNYMDNITLNTVAEREYLSPSYLSHFFEKNMGISFFNYLTGVRMNHAVYQLLNTDLTIEQIAANNGFSNSRYFVSCFKKEYGILPKQYQKERKKCSKASGENTMCFLLEQHDYLNKLGEYLNEEEYKPDNAILSSSKALHLNINTQSRGKFLRHTFKNFTGVGRAKEVLFHRIQSELRILQKEIGFRHIKFHGILDDSMMLYNEDRQGNPYLTFNYIDDLIDFLLSIGLKPFIQFSFMPRLLAKNAEKTLFFNPVIISEPKDYGKWEYLIAGLTNHLIQRYGIFEVRGWLFSFWNVPFLSYLFSFETNDIAYELYKRTRHCVKTCDSKLQFGNPSFGSMNFINSELYSFLDFCKKEECYPDFYNIHCYPVKIPDRDSLASLGSNICQDHKGEPDTVILSNDPDFMANVISSFKGKLTAYPKLPTYITEWASTSSHRDWLNDTCYRSVYIIKNILENYDEVESFGNWCLSDTLEELSFDNNEFHGELGLFTCRGIKKPAYYAFVFLNKLKDYLLERGRGYFITTNQSGDYAILLYNYHHISPLYAQGVLFNVTFMDRYNAFVDTHSLDFDLSLHLLQNGKYIITEHILNRDHGSAFDEWMRMGGLPLVTQEEIDVLQGRSMPKLIKQEKIITNESMYYTASLLPLEVRLILIQKQTI